MERNSKKIAIIDDYLCGCALLMGKLRASIEREYSKHFFGIRGVTGVRTYPVIASRCYARACYTRVQLWDSIILHRGSFSREKIAYGVCGVGFG